MEYLNSISPIHKCYNTGGSRPVEVLCEDFNSYICKYSRLPADSLCREYIGYCFAKVWGLEVPEAAFINIRKEHIDLQKIPQGISYEHFGIPLFGSRKIEYAKEVDLSFSGKNVYELSSIHKHDFLKIALFDIWLANEDRNHNNFNLLLHGNESDESFYFIPIDHEKIFNSGTLNYGIVSLTAEDSIIFSSPFSLLFKSHKSLTQEIEVLKTHFWGWISQCRERHNEMLEGIPETWKIDKTYLSNYLLNNIYTRKWQDSVLQQFLSFIQRK